MKKLIVLLVLLVFPIPVISLRAEDTPTIDPISLKLLNKLAESRLILSDGNSSYSSDFSFLMACWGKNAAEEDAFQMYIERSGDKSAMLTCNGSGLPFLFATDQAWFKLDTKVSGQLVQDTGSTFQFLSTGGDGFKLRWGLVEKDKLKSALAFDPSALCRDVLPNLTNCKFDEKSKVIVCKTPAATVEIEVAEQSASYPIATIKLVPVQGTSMMIHRFSVGKNHTPALTIVGKKEVDGLTFKRVELGVGKKVTLLPQAAVPDAEFWKNVNNIAAAKSLLRLFPKLEGEYAVKQLSNKNIAGIDQYYWLIVAVYDECSESIRHNALDANQRNRGTELVTTFRQQFEIGFIEAQPGKPDARGALFAEFSRLTTFTDTVGDLYNPSQNMTFALRILNGGFVSEEFPMRSKEHMIVMLQQLARQEISNDQKVQLSKLFVRESIKDDVVRVGFRAKVLDNNGLIEAEESIYGELFRNIAKILSKTQIEEFENFLKKQAEAAK